MKSMSCAFGTLDEQAVRALRTGETAWAERQFRHLLTMRTGDMHLMHSLGLSLLAQQKLPAALATFESVLNAAPDFLLARVDLARAHRSSEHLALALGEIRQVLRVAPSLAPAWLALGDILVDLQRYRQAAAAFHRAQTIDPDHSRLSAARNAWRAGNHAEAESSWRKLLQENASHVFALCGLAAANLTAGRAHQAECLLRHALLQSAHLPLTWGLLGQVYLSQDRLIEAEAATRHALKIEPRNEQCWIALAAINGRLMRPEAALAAYRQAERIDPSQKLLHLSIGHVLKTLGRRAECEQVYHECIERDPGEAYWSLADLKNYQFSGAEIADMDALLAAPSTDAANQTLLHFALGRARELEGYAEGAFRHYAAGNRLRRAQKPFDYDAFERKSSRLIKALDRDFFATHRGRGNPDDSPIFIVGLPRSGSTLVEQILASHSHVAGTMELSNILNYAREFEQLDAHGDSYPDSVRAAPRRVFAALGTRYLEETRPLRPGRARFIDKMPNNFSHIGLIHAMLPNATIIDVRRHPMDACFSCFKQYFAAGQAFTYDLEGLGRYYRQYLSLMDHWDAELPGKVLHVSYEALIRAPEQEIRRLLAHCRLPFEAACLRFHETKRAIRTSSSEQVRQPLYATGIGHWRRYERELAPLRASLGDSLHLFPEPAPYPRPHAATRPRFRSLSSSPASAIAPQAVLSLAIAAVLYTSFAARTARAEATDESLREIIVTARKRAENVQDVPQDIEVFGAQEIKNLRIERIEDFATLAPSMSMISTGPGGQRIFIRGVSDGSAPNYGYSNLSTTGFLVDDLSFSYYGHTPDLHLYDVERIEILNGPQGTLFGPSALSGAVRIITKKPDPSAFAAGVDVNSGKIEGGGNNSSYEGYANIPLVEGHSALRLSAYSVRDGGYIDNVLASRQWLNGVTSDNAAWAGRNQNTRHTVGGRAAVLQNLSDNWRVTLTGYFQNQNFRGSWDDDPTNVGPHRLKRFSPAGGYTDGRFLDLHVDGDVGIGDLIYVAGYSLQRNRHLYDFSEYVQYASFASSIQANTCVTDPASGPGDHGCKAPYMYGDVSGEIKRTSHELRLVSKADGRLHWTVGAYWEKTQDPYSGNEHLPNINFNGEPAQYHIGYYGNVATPTPGEFYSSRAASDYLSVSEFADLTVDIDARWSIEAGVEHYRAYGTDAIDYAALFAQARVPRYDSYSSHKTNYKAGINFKPRVHTLLYFAFAQGFRDGGINLTANNPTIPSTYEPDTLNNFELGFKTDAFHGRLVFSTAAYDMEWRGYQVSVPIPTAPYAFNANIGDARIRGLESSIEVRPMEGLDLSATVNYNDARLKSNSFQSPSFFALPGERLPEAPLLNFNAIARYERHVAQSLLAFAQTDIAHKSSMWNDGRVDVRILQPAYTLANMRFGVSDPLGSWRAEAYVTNVANKRAVIYSDITGYAYFPGHSNPEVAAPPRTFGLHLSYHWGKPE